MQIMRNDVYTIQGPNPDTIRVLYLLPDQNISVISLLRKDTLPYEISLADFEEAIDEGTAQQSNEYPTAYFPSPTEKQQKAAEESWRIIGEFVQDEPDCYDSKIRSRFIAGKSKESGLQRKQIQRLLYRYWAGGMTKHALYPRYERRGNPGRPRSSSKIGGRPVLYESNNQRLPIREQEKSFIEEAIKKYYTKSTKYTYRYAYQAMLTDHYTDKQTGLLADAYPTETQFRYHAERFVNAKMRHGSIKYNKDMRGITGSSRSEAEGPGDVYQVDATIADVYLVAQYDRTAVVGRPELYFVSDVFSRMIVGFYVCLESASWDNARMALLNTFTDKVALCSGYGVKICFEDWPCWGLPRSLMVDNGELVSKASNSIIEGLGITVKNAAAWRPDLKGIIESKFRLLNIDTKAALPGAVLPDFSQRGSEDYRLDAKLDLIQFTQMIIYFVLKHNKRQMKEHPQPLPDIISAHVPAIPIDLWNWGIANRTGILRRESPEKLEVALSQQGHALVTARGIKFHNLYYECKTSTNENWFSKARVKGSWEINIAYHPQDMGRIYWLCGGMEYEICTRTHDSGELYHGITLEEIDWYTRQASAQKAVYRDISLQQALDYDKAISGIIQEAEAARKTIPFDAAKMKAKPSEIRKHRKEEAERFRKLKNDEKVSPEQAEPQEMVEQISSEQPESPEMAEHTPKNSFDYSDLFAQFADEDDDEC